MSTVCVTAARVISSDGATERVDFEDRSIGLTVLNPVGLPRHGPVSDRYESPRAIGGFRRGIPRKREGLLVLNVWQEGSDYTEAVTRWAAVEEALDEEWDYFIELEVDGVRTRWRTEQPEIEQADLTTDKLMLNRLTFQLRFICQPNPTVMTGEES